VSSKLQRRIQTDEAVRTAVEPSRSQVIEADGRIERLAREKVTVFVFAVVVEERAECFEAVAIRNRA
jgi:hypothetical protein